MDSFNSITPFLVTITLIICIVFGKNATKKDLFTTDGMFSSSETQLVIENLIFGDSILSLGLAL